MCHKPDTARRHYVDTVTKSATREFGLISKLLIGKSKSYAPASEEVLPNDQPVSLKQHISISQTEGVEFSESEVDNGNDSSQSSGPRSENAARQQAVGLQVHVVRMQLDSNLSVSSLQSLLIKTYPPIKIIDRSFGSSKNTKLEDGPYCTISGNQPSSVTLYKTGSESQTFCCNFKNLYLCSLNQRLKFPKGPNNQNTVKKKILNI